MADESKHFADRLNDRIKAMESFACAGLDPRWDWIPDSLKIVDGEEVATLDAYMRFYMKLLRVVGGKMPAIKPQLAFFEDEPEWAGRITSYARHIHHSISIADCKRGDIGSTAEAYAERWLGDNSFDAITVNPYLGRDSLEPFVAAAAKHNKGVFVLVKTSNPGSHDFQDCYDHETGDRIYELVAKMVNDLGKPHIGASGYSCVGAVVGATVDKSAVSELRSLMPNTIFLMPGYGAQGGSIDSIQKALDPNGLGVLVPSSRSLNFPWVSGKNAPPAPENWISLIEQAAAKMNDELRSLRGSKG